MNDPNYNRRDFNKLTSAALGGLLAGISSGCTPPGPGTGTTTSTAAAAEIHLCRGLNTCKGKGTDGKNACAGQGTCASVKEHSCSGSNECKGQGGCGNNPGENSCKGQGSCSVPLMDKQWDMLRKKFEERMKKDNKPFGTAPEKKKD